MVHQVGGALDARVGQLTYFLAVETIPPAAVELFVEFEDEFGVDEVCEGVAYVAGVVVVYRQVQEIYVETMVFTDLLEEHVLGVLVGDVADHQSGPTVELNLNLKGFTLSGMMRYY